MATCSVCGFTGEYSARPGDTWFSVGRLPFFVDQQRDAFLCSASCLAVYGANVGKFATSPHWPPSDPRTAKLKESAADESDQLRQQLRQAVKEWTDSDDPAGVPYASDVLDILDG